MKKSLIALKRALLTKKIKYDTVLSTDQSTRDTSQDHTKSLPLELIFLIFEYLDLKTLYKIRHLHPLWKLTVDKLIICHLNHTSVFIALEQEHHWKLQMNMSFFHLDLDSLVCTFIQPSRPHIARRYKETNMLETRQW
jgi:hypothetical protein